MESLELGSEQLILFLINSLSNSIYNKIWEQLFQIVNSKMYICICVYDRICDQVKNFIYDTFIIFIKDLI